ncbi:MAG: AmmeMemoRadiSam system protein B [Pirellulales bacterium]|nr:AmmeMemoRadiSam system protein B [Pirellulales bacterium]
MTFSDHPRIRPLELVPLGNGDEPMYALRDPYGFSETVALPMGAAMLVTLMNGQRTLGELRFQFERQIGKSISMTDVERVVHQLDERYMLDNERFAHYQGVLIDQYRALDVRPAAHAGGSYESEVEALRAQLGELFTSDDGPGLLPWEGNSASDFAASEQQLCGVMSPHIDLQRGGPTLAWAYDRVVAESDAEVFVILGTAHTPLAGLFSVSRKHFDTPLGTVQTDREFIAALHARMSSGADAREAAKIFEDELPHRSEHSIEFQTLLLQYVLGGQRDYSIVPILVGSFHPFVQHNRSPGESPAVTDFVSALRETVANCDKKVCFVAGVDLAHIGQQFGDPGLLDDKRLSEQWTDDQELLARACEGDAEAWFIHVAAQADRNRICGLAPTYVMLETARPSKGELLKYDHAVAKDRTSCVSFASVAFYE